MLRPLFTEHPATVGETYGEHMAVAAACGLRMVFAGLACLVHAVLPFLFVRTGSATITALHERMVLHRRAPAGEQPHRASGALEAGARG